MIKQSLVAARGARHVHSRHRDQKLHLALWTCPSCTTWWTMMSSSQRPVCLFTMARGGTRGLNRSGGNGGAHLSIEALTQSGSPQGGSPKGRASSSCLNKRFLTAPHKGSSIPHTGSNKTHLNLAARVTSSITNRRPRRLANDNHIVVGPNPLKITASQRLSKVIACGGTVWLSATRPSSRSAKKRSMPSGQSMILKRRLAHRVSLPLVYYLLQIYSNGLELRKLQHRRRGLAESHVSTRPMEKVDPNTKRDWIPPLVKSEVDGANCMVCLGHIFQKKKAVDLRRTENGGRR
jgi:hypothetical protein